MADPVQGLLNWLGLGEPEGGYQGEQNFRTDMPFVSARHTQWPPPGLFAEGDDPGMPTQAHKQAALDAVLSPLPNALNQINRIGGGGEHGYDWGLTYRDVLMNAGYDGDLATIIGAVAELVEPGPGEMTAVSAGLVGVPVALQRLLAKHLNPNLLSPSGLPLTQFHGWGEGVWHGNPSTGRGLEGHGHYGGFTTPDPHQSNAQYSGRYQYGGRGPRPHESPGVVSGHAVTPSNPSVVPGSIFGPAQYLDDATAQRVRQMLGQLDPDLLPIYDNWLAKGPVSFSEVSKLIADHASFRASNLDHNLSLTDLHKAAGYDAHVDMRPGWSKNSSSIEVATYDPENIISLAPQHMPSGMLAAYLIRKGEDPAEVAAAMRSPALTPEQAAASQLEALRQVMTEYRPLAEKPRGGAYGSMFDGHLSTEAVLQRYMERVLVPHLLTSDQDYTRLPLPSRLGPSDLEIQSVDDMVRDPSLAEAPPRPRDRLEVAGGDVVYDLRSVPPEDLAAAIIEYHTLHGLPIDPQEVYRLVEQIRSGFSTGGSF